MSVRALVATAILATWSTAAIAQNDEQYRCYGTTDPRCSGDYCGNTFYNPTESMNWQRTLQAADQRAMAQLAGVYYGEQTAPQLGMVEQVYRSYEATGLWQYQDQTCGSTPGVPCSQNQGTGQWAGYMQSDGSMFVMVHFSDLSRTNNCFSQTIRPADAGFVDNSGISWRRVR